MAALHFAVVTGQGANEVGKTVTKCLATFNHTGYIDLHHAMYTVVLMRFLRLLVFLMCLKPALGAAETMVLAVAPGGYPPFLIAVPGKPVVGIMTDVLREIATAQGLRLKFVETPQMRVEKMILDRQVDAVPRAKEWVSQTDRFLFTDSVLRLRDVIFSQAKHPVLFRKPDDLVGKTVGTHLGYSYPLLEPLFQSKRAYREDAYYETSMLRMLKAGRTDVAVMNETVGLWLIKAENMTGQFTMSETELEGYEYRFMLGRQWSKFVVQFNRELAQMKKDGRLAAIIGRYHQTPNR